MEQQNPLAGAGGTRLEHCWDTRTKPAVPALARVPSPAFSITGWGGIGSMRGAAASHHGRGGRALVPEEEQQSDAPSPHTARVRDHKLHESPDLGTAREEKARGLLSLGIGSL